MASDYKKIAEEHEKDYGRKTNHLRIYKRLYSDKTHFVYELIQNADDSKSKNLELQLSENKLLVWNDGRQFKEKDVRSICSLGSSDKDLTHIGTFGIGFKAVYNYTDFPEIYSDDERFRIRDFVKPEGIDEITPEIEQLVNEGKTIFRLPFKDSPHQVDDIKHLKDRLRNLAEERSLLFLRHLKKVEWKDINNTEIGSYSSHRRLFDKIQDISDNESVELVKLTVSLNCNNKRSETFLVFSKKVKPQQNVIDELLERAEDEEEQQRILQSSEELQPIEVAFKLQDDRIIPIDDNCVLFAFLPTQKETHLKFLIQARYQTTPARDSIPKPHENPWNRWLVQETANFLPEVLGQLKIGGLLKPTFFNVLPLKGDVENEFKPVAEALQKAMRERAFVPTEKEGHYAKAENVFYPDTLSLRKLVKSSGMYPDSSLLDHDIRKGTKESGRCFEIMHEAGVKKINIRNMLEWLEKQSLDWFKERSNVWLRSLYDYLKGQKGQLRRIKKLPLIRLENGEHVCVSNQLVFFPPATDEEREEIAPFLDELPIVKSIILEGEERNNIEAFFKNLGVKPLQPVEMVNKWIIPQYLQSEKPSVSQNLLHVRYLFKIWDKISDTEIKKKISETPILRAYKSCQQENSDFVVPGDTYLSKTYTGDTDLENYFSVYDSEIWFVNDMYLESDSNRKDWLKFLKTIRVMETPQVIQESITVDYQNRQELEKYGLKWEYCKKGNNTIEDLDFEGLSEVLDQIVNHNNVDLSRILWCLLVKALPSRKYARDIFFRGIHCWYYYTDKQKYFDASTFYCQLTETAWLPDKQGNLHIPSECFAPTTENLLGDSVAYLHTDFDISEDNETRRWLAEKLGVHLNANTDSVMSYLQTLSGSTVNIENIVRLYRFLEDRSATGEQRQGKFKTESLIFTYDPEPQWWKADEVFWEDESHVFGDRRGYLIKNYVDYERTLKPFFIALGITERASPLHYVQVIQDISLKQSADADVRKRLKILYRRLWQSLQEGGSFLEDKEWQEKWEKTREGKCWLGKKGNEWGFFYSNELVWKDDDYISRLFKDNIPFWGFDNDLLEFAELSLDVKGCSESSDIEFDHYGDQGEYPVWSKKVQNLCPYIQDFLHSPRLCEGHGEEKSAKVLKQLSVFRAQELKVRCKLKGIPVPDPNPRQSFLEVTDKKVILWIGLKEDEKSYPDLIGDALQDYFGIGQLREFAKDLLLATDSEIDRTLLRWERRGFQPNLCLSPPESDSKEGDKNAEESVDEKFQDGTGSENDSRTNDSDVETSVVHENPETENGNDDSKENEPETFTYQSRPGGSRTHSRGGNRSSTPRGNRSTGYRGGSGGGGEGETHKDLKDYLADNPSELGEGLKLVKTEYEFKSGDKPDILFEDSSGKPITVEVKPPISSGSDQEVWQAVKYKHLAAVEYGLPCDQVDSILAAPIIPDDVKAKCEELGIKPIEVSLPNDTGDLNE